LISPVPRYQINWGNNWKKNAQIVRKASNLSAAFDDWEVFVNKPSGCKTWIINQIYQTNWGIKK